MPVPEDFDPWMKNPYTKVLMDSIRHDFAPRALLQDALTALEYHQAQTRPIESTTVTIAALRQALAGWGISSTDTAEHQQEQRERNAKAHANALPPANTTLCANCGMPRDQHLPAGQCTSPGGTQWWFPSGVTSTHERQRINELARQAGLPMSWLDTGKASAWPALERFACLVLADGVQGTLKDKS